MVRCPAARLAFAPFHHQTSMALVATRASTAKHIAVGQPAMRYSVGDEES